MKTKVSVEYSSQTEQTKLMGDIEYGEVCVVIEGYYKGDIIIKANNSDNTFIALNNFHKKDNYWGGVKKGKGMTVKPLPVGTKIIIEVLSEEKHINKSKKDLALDHYYNMKAYALTQPLDDMPSHSKMRDAIGEDWGGDFCPYCKARNPSNWYCELSPLNTCNTPFYCCDGLWIKLNMATTWKEWLERVDKVIDYIEEHG